MNASVLDVEDMSFHIDEKEETLGRRKRSRSDSKKKVKKFKVTPLRVPIPTDENCKFSDDLDDSVCTICKICDAEVTLTGMRRHTKLKHKLKITKYKELHGPFKIIEHVYHKCHLCDKILILDNDAMGGHIKFTHKMKEKVYKEVQPDHAVLPQDRAVQGGQPEQAGWYSLLTIIFFLLCILPGSAWQ